MAVVRNIPKGAKKLSEEASAQAEEKVAGSVAEETSKFESAEGSEEKQGLGSEDSKGFRRTSTSKKVCFFHKNKTEPAYWDTTTLRKFLNDRGRINPRSRTGTCAKHQRRVGKEIKRSRFLALLPYATSI